MSAVAEIQPMFFDEEGGRDVDIQFDPNHFEAVTPYSDDLNDEYEQAQEQLRQLRAQEEQIRQQAEELEELSRREEEFKTGNEEICTTLESYLKLLDREATEAQRIAEDCAEAHERFESHLNNLHMLRPETWSRADRKAELARALGYVESANNAVENTMPLIDSLSGTKKPTGIGALFAKGSHHGSPGSMTVSDAVRGEAPFSYWLKSGFAFSLPVIIFAFIAFVVMSFL